VKYICAAPGIVVCLGIINYGTLVVLRISMTSGETFVAGIIGPYQVYLLIPFYY
jgi:hypothetical protein